MKKIIFFMIICSSLLIANESKIDMYEYDSLFAEISEKRVGIEKEDIKKVKNPFVMVYKKVENKDGTKTVTASKAEIVYTLYAILGNKAKINNNWYKLNDKIGYYKLSKIKQKSVLLRGASDKKELFIRKHHAKNVKFSSK